MYGWQARFFVRVMGAAILLMCSPVAVHAASGQSLGADMTFGSSAHGWWGCLTPSLGLLWTWIVKVLIDTR